MLEYKKILVIDDVGDIKEEFANAFRDNSEIEGEYSSSDFDDLENHLDLGNILILINKDGLKNDLNKVVHFIQKSFFYLPIPVVILSSDESFVEDVDYVQLPS